jgi:hypothetical protein
MWGMLCYTVTMKTNERAVALTVVEWRSAKFRGLTQWIVVDERGESWGAGGTLEGALALIAWRLGEAAANG